MRSIVQTITTLVTIAAVGIAFLLPLTGKSATVAYAVYDDGVAQATSITFYSSSSTNKTFALGSYATNAYWSSQQYLVTRLPSVGYFFTPMTNSGGFGYPVNDTITNITLSGVSGAFSSPGSSAPITPISWTTSIPLTLSSNTIGVYVNWLNSSSTASVTVSNAASIIANAITVAITNSVLASNIVYTVQNNITGATYTGNVNDQPGTTNFTLSILGDKIINWIFTGPTWQGIGLGGRVTNSFGITLNTNIPPRFGITSSVLDGNPGPAL